MKGRCLLLVWVLLTILAACDDGARQRLQLEELERMNRADSLMTNDSLALDLAEWFDDHGTPNEQMRAYYILGRTYADLGEAPQAIEAYNDAADRADTTDVDCDYYTLCRVYSQMSDILYNQNLLEEYLKISDLSIKYAWKAKDTLTVLSETALKMTTFNDLGETDSVLSVLHSVRNVFGNYYGEDKIAQYYVLPINALLKKNDVNTVRQLLYLYEEKSGFFDLDYTIAEGHEIYYYYKGLYYLAINQLDSAKYFFEKEYENGKDFNNQNASTHGLSLVFLKKHQYDSAAVYSQYAYALNDSANNHFTTQVVAQSQAMYNYNRHYREAQQERENAEKSKHRLITVLITSILLLLLASRTMYTLQLKRTAAVNNYLLKVEQLRNAQYDLAELRKQELESKSILIEKERNIQLLQSEVDSMRSNNQLIRDTEKTLIEDSGIGQLLDSKAAHGQKLSETDWQQIEQFVKQNLPVFSNFITQNISQLGLSKSRACILLRLNVGIKSTGSMMGVSSAYISKISAEILSDMFHKDGSGKKLAELLRTIS